jgi:hypothetical protein
MVPILKEGETEIAVALIPRKHGVSAATYYHRGVGFGVSLATFTVLVAAIDDISAFGGSANSPEFEAYAWYCENDSP